MNAKPIYRSRAFWLRQMRQWHWISAAVSLIGMLMFAATGITLNHASQIEARPHVTTQSRMLPADLVARLKGETDMRTRPLPAEIAAWIHRDMGVRVDTRDGEWSAPEVYVALPRPGGDAWLRIDRDSGEVQYERTDRGWVSYLNDLHKGRNAGPAWSLFIDVFAVACVVFCLTGLVLLQLMAVGRPTTWPLVGLGVLIPVLLAIFLIH